MCNKIFRSFTKIYYLLVIKLKYSWTLRKKRKKEKKIRALLLNRFSEIKLSKEMEGYLIENYLTVRDKILDEKLILYTLKTRRIDLELEDNSSK